MCRAVEDTGLEPQLEHRVGDLRIPRPSGENRSDVTGAVHRSPATIWARGSEAA